MVFKKLFSSEKAVSPVIGVMLMIVVTVILAAAVSSYASSVKTQDSAPQATLKASASIADGYVVLEHLGGDTLPLSSMSIEISYGTTSGYGNMSNVTFSPDSSYLRPGDTAKLSMLPYTYTYSGITYYNGLFKGDDIKLSVPRGAPFKVTVIDKNTGQTVCSSTITMNP